MTGEPADSPPGFCPANPLSIVTPQSHPTVPQQQRLALIEQARQAVLESRAPVGQPTLAPWVERSWRRCLDLGLEPRQHITFDAVSSSAAHHALEANQPLLRAAAPVIQSLSRAMAHTRYFAILTDARGLVIDVNGPVDRHDPHAANIARIGVDLSERAVGTTAIGTTLAELQPVWLHRGEHFFNATSVYSCAGAPIWGPDGHCVGMLDLTGINDNEQPALKHLVAQSARTIENAMALARPHHLLLRMNWPGRVLGEDSDGLIGLDADGNITGLNRPAADMLGVAPGSVNTLHSLSLRTSRSTIPTSAPTTAQPSPITARPARSRKTSTPPSKATSAWAM